MASSLACFVMTNVGARPANESIYKDLCAVMDNLNDATLLAASKRCIIDQRRRRLSKQANKSYLIKVCRRRTLIYGAETALTLP